VLLLLRLGSRVAADSEPGRVEHAAESSELHEDAARTWMRYSLSDAGSDGFAAGPRDPRVVAPGSAIGTGLLAS
jgi:hypothetical protein